MGKFDLNNATDFARATNSFGAGIVQALTAKGSTNWLIDEGKYTSGVNNSNSVIFHVFTSNLDYQGALSRIADSGGRRKAKFEFPFLDAQLTNDLGRKAEDFSLDIVLHGNNYFDAFKRLMNILNEPTPGILTHPVRGPINCGMETYEIIHQSEQRKAVAITLHMTEHSLKAELALAGKIPTNSVPSKLANLVKSFAKIENAINTVQANLIAIQQVKNTIKAGLELYQNLFSIAAGSMNATFNAAGIIPALLPTQSGGLTSGGEVIANAVTTALSPKDPFASAPVSLVNNVVTTALAINHIQKQIETARFQAAQSIMDLSSALNGQGGLVFHSNIVDIRNTVVDMQDTFEAGKQSSQAKIINFKVPRTMSVREAAFANGIKPDDSVTVALLNPSIESLNFIPAGTVLLIPLPA